MTDPEDILAALAENKALLADGFEDALIGFVEQFNSGPIALYDKDACLDILMSDGLSFDEAVEYFEYNVVGSWNGPKTPMFATLGRLREGETMFDKTGRTVH